MDHPPEAEALIRDARVARFATVDSHGRPHVVPVCFVYQDGAFYSALDGKPKRVPAERLQRVRNILEDPHVQVLIDRYDEDWSKLAYVQLRGLASLLHPGPEHAGALRLLQAKYPQYASLALEEAPFIKVAVERSVIWTADAPV